VKIIIFEIYCVRGNWFIAATRCHKIYELWYIRIGLSCFFELRKICAQFRNILKYERVRSGFAELLGGVCCVCILALT
jgi:hypothetical protein